MLPHLAPLLSLTSLRLQQRDGFELPGPLTALRQLAALSAAVRYQDDPLLVAPAISCLTSLRALWLQQATFQDAAALAALPGLHTLGLVGSAHQYAAVLSALAAGAPQGRPLPLRALHLEAHASAVAEVAEETWSALAALPAQLTRLALPFCRLTELPPGSYLQSLQVCILFVLHASAGSSLEA